MNTNYDFSMLEFKKHSNPYLNTQSIFIFPNNYGISVVNGYAAQCNTTTYEVAILKDNNICYDTVFTNDVLTYQSKDDITKLMNDLSKL